MPFSMLLLLAAMRERKGAVPADVDEFRRGVERPKWYVPVQELP
jgi:hypothetical protein